MDKNGIAKKYLISAALLYFIGAVVIGVLLLAFDRLGDRFSLGADKLILITLLCPILPLGSYTGFVVCGTRVKEIKTKNAWMIVVFYPVILVFITVFGIAVIIPYTFKSIGDIIRG